MAYEIQKVWDRHHNMKRLAILGLSNRQIARACGVSEVTVNNVLSSPLMRQQLELMQAAADVETLDVNAKLQRMAEKAVDLLDKAMSDEQAPLGLRAKIAMDALDRSGHPKHTAISGSIVHAHLTKDDIDAIKEEAIKRLDCIDAEYKTLPEPMFTD
jgi:hypothetical protein